MSVLKRLSFLTFAGILSLCTGTPTAHAQRSSAMERFLEHEKQNWMEYIEHTSSVRSDTSFDVRFYHIQVDIAIDSPFIEGRVRCDFEAVSDGLASIALNLHHSLPVDSITGNVSAHTEANDTIFIDLDRPYSAGEPASVTIFYGGEPELVGDNIKKGLRYETHSGGEPIIATLSTPFLAHTWWPCKDGPGDKPDSIYIDIAVPDTVIGGRELIAVSNGVLDTVVTAGGKRICRWRERFPIVPYYVMAAISNYRHFGEIYEGAHGEMFPLDYYVFDEHYDSAVEGVEDLPGVMDLFSDVYGTYPFEMEKYGMTQLGFYGAIENQTNTIINNMSGWYFEVTVHELAHMWFGDMITCRDWHHGWLNEGFATYSEALWAEHNGGFQAYKDNMAQNEYLSGGTLYLQDISDPFNIFIDIIYEKGAYVLHMLRGVLGDETFFDAIYRYAQDPAFRYDHAVTEDFQEVCESESGMDLDFFFDQWIYDEFYPRYEYSWSQDRETFETSVTIRQVQESYGWRPVFEMPVQVECTFDSGIDTVITVWNDSQVQHFDFAVGDTIQSVALDPDKWILRQTQYTGIEDECPEGAPRIFALEQNYPNPFNPTTTIRFTLAGSEGQAGEGIPLTLRVYSSRGKLVRTLVDGERSAGMHEVAWDGRDEHGHPAGSGVFFYRLETADHHDTRKMLVIE